jgi:hypothetical protein
VSSQPGGQPSIGRIYAAYLGIRMAIFLAILALCIVAGLRGLVAVLVALVISGVLSYPLARRQRDALTRQFERRHPR